MTESRDLREMCRDWFAGRPLGQIQTEAMSGIADARDGMISRIGLCHARVEA